MENQITPSPYKVETMTAPIKQLKNEANRNQFGPKGYIGLADEALIEAFLMANKGAGIETSQLNVEGDDVTGQRKYGECTHQERAEFTRHGDIYVYFEDYDNFALIRRTYEKKLVFFKQQIDRAYFFTNHTPVLVSEPFKDLSSALIWVSKRMAKYIEVLPEIVSLTKS